MDPLKQTLSDKAIQTAISKLADPAVNTRVELASTSYVAKRIIERLPGVEMLKTHGPEVEKALLDLTKGEESLRNENLMAIALHILESYPSSRVKIALAKLIVAEKFNGRNLQFASEAFLKAAHIEALSKDAVRIARREARKVLDPDEKQKASLKDKTQTYSEDK